MKEKMEQAKEAQAQYLKEKLQVDTIVRKILEEEEDKRLIFVINILISKFY